MDNKKKKQIHLSKLKSKSYKVYGIFDFQKNTLIYVDLDLEKAELEMELGDYDSEQYDIVSFNITLT